MGGNNKAENIIRFTARQHFLAHWMLWKAYRNPEMTYAFKMMEYSNKSSQRTNKYWNVSSKVYEKLKIEKSQHFSGVNHPNYGKRYVRSEVTRIK